MSVIIKGIQIPQSCYDCPCHASEWSICQASNDRMTIMESLAPKYCPLIEIPEKHGRLIDTDKLIISDIKDVNGDYWTVVHLSEIDCAPTFFESEE